MRTRVIFTGRVQGVGFRATAHAIALRHAVTGWVRNEQDGTVQLEAQGDAPIVEAFLTELRSTMRRNIKAEAATASKDVPNETEFVIAR